MNNVRIYVTRFGSASITLFGFRSIVEKCCMVKFVAIWAR